jgi:hypothetical protein
VENFEVYNECWKSLSVAKREDLLRRALHHFGEAWNGPTVAEMAEITDINQLPALFLFGFLAPLMI